MVAFVGVIPVADKPVGVKQVGVAAVVNCAVEYTLVPITPQLARTRHSYSVDDIRLLMFTVVSASPVAALVQLIPPF